MSLEEFDAGTATSFCAEIGGIQIGNITEVSGLKIEIDIIEMKMNEAQKGKYVNRKIMGRKKSGEITLKRYWHAHNSFKEWLDKVDMGQLSGSRKNGVVKLLDTSGDTLQGFEFINGMAKSLELSNLKAGSTEAIVETLVISHEGCSLAS
jgi:phage tail-like protein